FPVEWLVPYIQIIHDRVTLEIMRGCPNRCRFCQARSQYYPLRIRKAEKILELAKQAYKNSGYEEISLGGLSVSDYPKIEEVSACLLDAFKDEAVSVSLPSIKAHAYVGNLSSIIAKVKKTGLTFAPEAGSDKLRNLLLKDFDEKEFFRALLEAYGAGYQRVKLYFMVGLPFETDADLDAIADFSRRVSEERRKVAKGAAEVNISINTLIPKPHTAFQWFGMSSPEEMQRKYDYLKAKVKSRHLKLNFHNRQMSMLEGILSRGDRRLSVVILNAFKKGAKFDAWSDHFDFQKWAQAFAETGVDPAAYLKERNRDSSFPWDFLDVGINKDSLRLEFDKLIENKGDKVYNH
ncbi:MAG: radical SAM protein, partial [Candidatus Omnitrophota bacterium]